MAIVRAASLTRLRWLRPGREPLPQPPPVEPDRRAALELSLLGLTTLVVGFLVLLGAPAWVALLPLAGLAVRLGLPRLLRARPGRPAEPARELRVMTDDLYGINGEREGAAVSVELCAGTDVLLERDAVGGTALRAEEMRFPLDPPLLERVLSHSRRVA